MYLTIYLCDLLFYVHMQGGCKFVALLLHYIFLSAFCWMLCEGIVIYILLYFVLYKGFFLNWKFYIALGYGKHITAVTYYKSVAICKNLRFAPANCVYIIWCCIRSLWNRGNVRSQYDQLAITTYNTNMHRCWLSEENGAIWAFIVPMLLIILV